MTGSNLGRSEELSIFKKAGLSGTIGTLGSSSLARSLLQFDFSSYLDKIADGLIISGTSYVLRLNHKTAVDPLPSSYDAVVRPVSSSWDEGAGLDVVGLRDDGFSNWMKRNSTTFWNNPGGDFLSSPTGTFHFDEGDEDLELDVTNIVVAWLTGNLSNNGLAISLTGSIESDSLYTDYETKKFYSRQTGYDDRKPYIEARGNDFISDDRNNMRWGASGTLYLYNVVGGQLRDLTSSTVYVTVSDSSGVLQYLTASHDHIGIYSASFALQSGSYSGSLFYDKWGSGSFSLMTGSFTLSQEGPEPSLIVEPLTARVKNLRVDYTPDELVRFEVLFRRGPRAVSVVRSTASLNQTPYIVENAFYAIENDATRERVVPFGTGSELHTKLSYGAFGNYFDFSMSNLHAGNVYRLVLLVDEEGRRQVIDDGTKFRVI